MPETNERPFHASDTQRKAVTVQVDDTIPPAPWNFSHTHQPSSVLGIAHPPIDSFQIPRLQDDEDLIRNAAQKTSFTHSFEASYCQRILFVWGVVFDFCRQNHNLALHTWVQLLERVTGDDIWLWADGDEKRLEEFFGIFTSDYPSSLCRGEIGGGWQLSDSDLRLGIDAIARRSELVREGALEGLDMAGRRKRLQDVNPSLRFCAIVWCIGTSEAVRQADGSLGVRGRHLLGFIWALDEHMKFPSPAEDVVKSYQGPLYQVYQYKMRKAGHTCHEDTLPLEKSVADCWIYVKLLVAPDRDIDVTQFKDHCGCPASHIESPQQSGRGNRVLHTEGQGPSRPALYLIFLWCFWSSAIHPSYQYFDGDRGYYNGMDVREWLEWIRGLTSHETWQQVSRVLRSKRMESWLSMDFLRPGDQQRDWDETGESDEVEFVLWVYSVYPGTRRCDITCVSQGDWDEAQRIIDTAEHQEIAETDADVRAMLGALYLIPHMPTLQQARASLSGSCMKYMHQLFGQLEKAFENGDFTYPPPVIFTPAMSRFRNTLHITHPTYCKELGSDFVTWYSACMAFMGVTHNFYDSTEGGMQCKVRGATKRLRDILITQESARPAKRQKQFSLALRDLADVAAAEDLRFEFPGMIHDTNAQTASFSNESPETGNLASTVEPSLFSRSGSRSVTVGGPAAVLPDPEEWESI